MFSLIFIYGWGAAGHKIINRRSTFSLPPSMNFLNWPDSLAAHSSDADYRRSSDPDEAPRHYIDIDNYPEFIATGRISQDLDSLIALHGSSFVYDNGILPFSIMATTDSVKKYFQLNNFQKPCCMPLTWDTMLVTDIIHFILQEIITDSLQIKPEFIQDMKLSLLIVISANIIYAFHNATYVSDINQYVFNFLYHITYVDSVLKYDSLARAIAGSYNTNYYQIYWQLAGNFTVMLFNNASHFLSDAIYTAWVNSGRSVSVISTGASLPENIISNKIILIRSIQ
ncbi:MAG: hypothetical protein IPG99_02940 [Ignavibacteria bacterium]|nr:hypothetical protein [Ignavibacteria bacterium]